jgi:hypothetical protein
MARAWSTAERIPEFNIVEANTIYGSQPRASSVASLVPSWVLMLPDYNTVWLRAVTPDNRLLSVVVEVHNQKTVCLPSDTLSPQQNISRFTKFLTRFLISWGCNNEVRPVRVNWWSLFAFRSCRNSAVIFRHTSLHYRPRFKHGVATPQRHILPMCRCNMLR